ncbi:MAG: hypothetical protein IKD04_07280 [Clostridia bacterium]|nr:hypothetical protein [Clostridia bacterium]
MLVLALLLSFSACSSTKDAYIYFELPSPPATLDPQTASQDSELLIIKNAFEGLLRKNAKGEIVCGAAKEYETDGLNYTFILRNDIKWHNGDSLTAADFEFAFKRAVSPETNAPFVSRLFCIKNAEDIYNGRSKADSLGVKAVNETTLVINLETNDEYFLETLTTSISMPCNQKFFEEAAGKYGLFANNILSNGSYKLTRWRKDPFGIRLYRNDEYSGEFVSENAAVFLTCDKDEAAFEKLKKNSVDISFIDCALTDEAATEGLKTYEFENICWFLTMSDKLSPNMRKSFSLLLGGEVFSKSLENGYSPAASIFPIGCFDIKISNGIAAYNPEAAKKLYLQELNKLQGKKFPSDIVLYYYDDGYVKNAVTDIVGHWQSNFSAFVNIEAASEAELLTSQLKDQTYAMALFPVKADSALVAEYLKKFGVKYNGKSLADIQSQLLKDNSIVPVMFQKTVIAYSHSLSNIFIDKGNGYIDFAFIVKSE